MNPALYQGPQVFLGPGDLYFGTAPLQIHTLLGSCVAITLWHPRLHLGGMCHFVLASRQNRRGEPPDGRFGDEAFLLLLDDIRQRACRPADFQAKLFGGGLMFAGPGTQPDIGSGNIEQGRKLLREAGMLLVSEHVGGSGRRKLTFDLASGHVWLAFPEGEGAYRRNHNVQ
ncbi:MAG: chemotaxis protein CheD [Azovibrio sp.]|uniref:chemotaxis protein CheD n=1 Tax=Azovibrio sp. TaxID=1872673 RepID=UPI003C751A47